MVSPWTARLSTKWVNIGMMIQKKVMTINFQHAYEPMSRFRIVVRINIKIMIVEITTRTLPVRQWSDNQNTTHQDNEYINAEHPRHQHNRSSS
jgi:hypothetical protein